MAGETPPTTRSTVGTWAMKSILIKASLVTAGVARGLVPRRFDWEKGSTQCDGSSCHSWLG